MSTDTSLVGLCRQSAGSTSAVLADATRKRKRNEEDRSHPAGAGTSGKLAPESRGARRHLIGSLSYANIVSTLALFMALGGVGAAATGVLAPGSVGPPQLAFPYASAAASHNRAKYIGFGVGCRVVVRDGVNQEQRAEFDGWVVAHRGRLWPDEESGLVYYEIPLADELRAGE